MIKKIAPRSRRIPEDVKKERNSCFELSKDRLIPPRTGNAQKGWITLSFLRIGSNILNYLSNTYLLVINLTRLDTRRALVSRATRVTTRVQRFAFR